MLTDDNKDEIKRIRRLHLRLSSFDKCDTTAAAASYFIIRVLAVEFSIRVWLEI